MSEPKNFKTGDWVKIVTEPSNQFAGDYVQLERYNPESDSWDFVIPERRGGAPVKLIERLVYRVQAGVAPSRSSAPTMAQMKARLKEMEDEDRAGAGPSEREAPETTPYMPTLDQMVKDLMDDHARESRWLYESAKEADCDLDQVANVIRKLKARAAVPQPASLYQEMLDELEDVYDFAVVEKVALGETEIESIRNLISRARAAAVPAPGRETPGEAFDEENCAVCGTPESGHEIASQLHEFVCSHKQAIEQALKYASGRWCEWGSRAESVRDILENAVADSGATPKEG